jgi:tryptophanyl-tRNA synthetase
MKERIVSGIQPSGEMHAGNYLGALKDFVALQDDYDCYFFIADLHSLTEDFHPLQKTEQILGTMAAFLAVGVNPDRSAVFVQSHVPAHAELAWIFNTLTPLGELERMTQFKDKAGRQAKNINAGLLTYPVLQAADILLYRPAYVPVGQDQLQHLEMTNTVARKFNHRFGQTFKLIKPYLKTPIKVMSLSNPEKKMSKSDPASVLNIFDDPDAIRKKLSKAVTATDAPENQMPDGVRNLFNLLEQFGGKDDYGRLKKDYHDGGIKYADLKKTLAEAVIEYFAPMKARRDELLSDKAQLLAIDKKGAEKAAALAEQTLSEIKTKIGLV